MGGHGPFRAVEQRSHPGQGRGVGRGADEEDDVQTVFARPGSYVFQAVGRQGVRPEEVMKKGGHALGGRIRRGPHEAGLDHAHRVQSQPMT